MRVFLLLVAFLALARAFVPPVKPVAPKTALNVVKVNVGEEEPIEDALRRFKRAVLRSGHMQLLRRRRTFEKNPERKKRLRQERDRVDRIMTLKNQKYKVYYK
uniref:30S ribosomal protein S21 n=1 Tax=Pinguiococcus pyrenoidosus TaxID=172671 RepID=A0A7R9UG78_9STRA|mmetsp:Transcript_9271/g.34776  ORF Transcript_9271/g.34776 Transcript_9271/m.34776 type:complete len:103 (+) Transcript_9271:29-337(+)